MNSKLPVDLTARFASFGDASADRTLQAISIYGGYRHVSISLAIANVGTPVGVFIIKTGDVETLLDVYPTPTSSYAIPTATAEYHINLDGIETNSSFIQIMWDVTSGGIGAAITGSMTLSE
jgi:hypothetical protein